MLQPYRSCQGRPQSQKIRLCHASPNPSDDNLQPPTMVEAGEKLEPTMDSSSGSPAGVSSVPGTANSVLGAPEESLLEGRKGCL